MKKLLVLGNVLFDYSGGEYECSRVDGIFLGICELEDEREIQAYCQKLLEDYVDADCDAVMYDGAFSTSTFKIKEM